MGKKQNTKKSFPSGRVVVDFETDGLDVHTGSRPFIVGMEDEQGNVRKARIGGSDWKMAAALIQDPKIEKISHNKKFEIKHSRHLGLIPRGPWHDTMGKSVLVDEYQKHSLGDLSAKWLDDHSKDLMESWKEDHARQIMKEARRELLYTDIPDELIEEYLEGDLDKTLRLDWKFRWTEEKYKGVYGMEMDLVEDLDKMEGNGLHINLEYVKSEIMRLRPRADELERAMVSMAGVRFNPRAPEQLGTVMQEMGLDTGERTKSGQMSTAFEHIEELDPDSNPFLASLIEYRGIQKIVGTYLNVFNDRAPDGILHGSFHQFGKTKGMLTGRISSSGPSLHTMPGERSKNKILNALSRLVRKAIVPPPGHSIISMDFNQVEPRLFACCAGDEQMMRDLRSGVDIYVAFGNLIFGAGAFDGLDEKEYARLRFVAKTMVLALSYGMGAAKLANKLGIATPEAQRLKNSFFARSPATRQFMLNTMRDLLRDGVVTDRFGRDYHVPKDLAYKATNALIQGGAATVMKKAVIRTRPLESMGVRRLAVIHDEMLASCPTSRLDEVVNEMARLMTDTASFEIPLTVSAAVSDRSWGDKQPYKLRPMKL